jgi:hypothetical protein
MSNLPRLTKSNVSDLKLLSDYATETLGLLGLYEEKDFKTLTEAMTTELWTLQWLPSRTDSRVGRIKLRPNSDEATRILNKARANRVIKRHKWLRMPFAIRFVNAVKRHPHGQMESVQDFLLRNYRHAEGAAICDNPRLFKVWVTERWDSKYPLENRVLDAIRELFPKVKESMERPFTKPGQQQKDQVESVEEPAGDSDAVVVVEDEPSYDAPAVDEVVGDDVIGEDAEEEPAGDSDAEEDRTDVSSDGSYDCEQSVGERI